MQLHEKYRPQTWSDVVGQDKAVARIIAMRDRCGLSGRAFWISGKSGTGKTTIARLIAAEVADDFFTTEIDATTLTPAALAEIERIQQARGWGKGGRAYLINEAHGLRRDTIKQLLVTLERLPPHVVWIFTTTSDQQDKLFDDYDDAGPLLSRCTVISLAQRDLADSFAERARSIAQAEGLDGKPLAEYKRLVNRHKGNLRYALQDIENGAMLD
jgi:DNA polymerase III gamma/tau subunit